MPSLGQPYRGRRWGRPASRASSTAPWKLIAKAPKRTKGKPAVRAVHRSRRR